MTEEDRIKDTMCKMDTHLRNHNSICISVSGGSDSDVIVHIVAKYFRDQLPKIHFVFSDTGLEYRATKEQLRKLECNYNINIDRIHGMPIPYAVKKYGVPFLSKQVSEYIRRLQLHDFMWDDIKPENCEVAFGWWSNSLGEKSRFNINQNSYLKEFMTKNPPKFSISNMCCQKSKKDPLIRYQKEKQCDLVITGERKSEGGARARKKSCFEISHGFDHYMPLFFWDDNTKLYYETNEGIEHSRCYTEYGLERTGCVGCPFARDRRHELDALKRYEPNLYKACMNVFGESYDYTDRYREYQRGERQKK